MLLFQDYLTPLHATRNWRLTTTSLPSPRLGSQLLQSSSLDYVETWSLQHLVFVLLFGAGTEKPWQIFLLGQPLIRMNQCRVQRPCPKPLLMNNLLCDSAGDLSLLGFNEVCGVQWGWWWWWCVCLSPPSQAWRSQQGSHPCVLGPRSPGAKHCVAGITSSSSLSEEELLAVLSEARAFFGVFAAWAGVEVAAGTAGLRLSSIKIRGVLITLKNKNKKKHPSND